MKKKICSFAVAAALAAGTVGFLPDTPLPGVLAAGVITVTDGCESSENNVYITPHVYGNQDKTVRSYLYESDENTLTRVEFITTSTQTVNYWDLDTGYVLVENIDMKTGALKSSKKLDLSSSVYLPLFGGFYAGEKYNYIVTGQANLDESNDQSVFAVTRISKDFKSFKTKILKGRNTYIPFKAGSCRMTEAGGKLYIHTCHQMYQSDDGNRHQANMSFVFDPESMTFEQEHYEVTYHYSSAAFNYISHSFDQFIVSDDEAVYSYDSGDYYPRALALSKYDLSKSRRYDSEIVAIPDATSHYNYTSVLTGGMALSKDNVITGVKMADMSAATLDEYTDLKDIYVIVTPKSSIGNENATKLVNLTNYQNKTSSTMRNSAPKIVKINDDKFIVMWKEVSEVDEGYKYNNGTWSYVTTETDPVTKIAVIDGSGKLKGSIMSSDEITLSDCDPVLCSDGMVRWYTAKDTDSAPVLYTLDPNEPGKFGAARISGDADNDGDLTLKDVTLILQYLAGWSVDINLANANVTGGDRPGIKDVTAIKQKLANWNVTLE